MNTARRPNDRPTVVVLLAAVSKNLYTGAFVGVRVGTLVGARVGARVGAFVGARVGEDGTRVGARVGACVGDVDNGPLVNVPVDLLVNVAP